MDEKDGPWLSIGAVWWVISIGEAGLLNGKRATTHWKFGRELEVLSSRQGAIHPIG